MIAKLDLKETRSLVLLKGIKSKGSIPFCIIKDDILVDSGTVRVNSKRKVKVIREGNNFTFLVKINLDGVLIDHTNIEQELDETKLQIIENQVAADIKKQCNNLIIKMQEEWEVDCIDISKYALAKWRKELTPVIDKGFIENVNIQVEVQVDIENAGELT